MYIDPECAELKDAEWLSGLDTYRTADAIKEKYGSKINFEVAQSEGVFLMSSETKDVAVKDVVEEFSLETRRKYFERALKIREKSLKF